jgi:hypothetical protein
MEGRGRSTLKIMNLDICSTPKGLICFSITNYPLTKVKFYAMIISNAIKVTVPCNMWHEGIPGHVGNVVHAFSYSTMNRVVRQVVN